MTVYLIGPSSVGIQDKDNNTVNEVGYQLYPVQDRNSDNILN